MMAESVPNRLCTVPRELYDRMDDVLNSDDHVRYRMIRVVRIAYSRGYQDGYRDGHADAENGHDERFEVSLA